MWTPGAPYPFPSHLWARGAPLCFRSTPPGRTEARGGPAARGFWRICAQRPTPPRASPPHRGAPRAPARLAPRRAPRPSCHPASHLLFHRMILAAPGLRSGLQPRGRRGGDEDRRGRAAEPLTRWREDAVQMRGGRARLSGDCTVHTGQHTEHRHGSAAWRGTKNGLGSASPYHHLPGIALQLIVRSQWLGKLERNQQMLPLLCSAAVLGALLQWRTERYRASPRKGGMALTQNPCDISHAHTSINQCALPCQPGSVGGCGSGRPKARAYANPSKSLLSK